jgi:hypothetical protein
MDASSIGIVPMCAGLIVVFIDSIMYSFELKRSISLLIEGMD